MNSADKIKEILKDGEITVGVHTYKFTPTTHTNRVKISAYLSEIKDDLIQQKMGFIAEPKFQEMKDIIDGMTLVNDGLLSKEKDHWEMLPIQDYYNFYITMMTIAVEVLPERAMN